MGFEAERDKQGRRWREHYFVSTLPLLGFFTSRLLLSVFFFDKHRRDFSTSNRVSGVCPLRLCSRFFYRLIISLCLSGFPPYAEDIHSGRNLPLAGNHRFNTCTVRIYFFLYLNNRHAFTSEGRNNNRRKNK